MVNLPTIDMMGTGQNINRLRKQAGLSVKDLQDIGNDGFKPHRSYCGYRTMAVRQIVALLMGA